MSLVKPEDLVKASSGLRKFGGKTGAKIILNLLGLSTINKKYATLDTSNSSVFIDSLLEKLEIKFELNEESLANIPKEGAFIVVGNHPFGAIEGVILLKILTKIRPDFKVMANFLLKRIPPLADYFIGVNPFESRPDIKSTGGLKQAIKHLKDGYPLGIFPAGEVSSYQKGFHIADKKWSTSILRFIKKAEVPVIPIYFDGKNSSLFYMLGKIHPMLRTLKLPSELLNKKNKTIKLAIGQPISVKEQEQFSDIEEYGKFLRTNTYLLSNTLSKKQLAPKKITQQAQIIPPIAKEILAEEIANLDAEHKLFETKNFQVFCPPSTLIPNILQEIGRLRESTFRAVGEGTNQSIDIDKYDTYYNHLFIWDTEEKSIVGAYRIGKGKEILEQYGTDGFYLKSLFKMHDNFTPILEKSLELGRSFIVGEYQKQPLPLFLLWKGILSMLMKNREYRYLIGPVSISNDYSTLAKEIIVKTITKYHFDEELAKLVAPRNAFKFSGKNTDIDILIASIREDINKLDKCVGQFENTETRLPVLLKKYISLNAKIICFNEDPLFNDCLDGFIVLDLHNVPEKMLDNLSKEFDADQIKERFEK